MSSFRTPVKTRPLCASGNDITIPPSPALQRLGYGTGISVLQLVRSPCAGQLRSPWALKMLNKKVKKNTVYSQRLQAEADLLSSMSHPNVVGFRAFGSNRKLFLGMESCDSSLGDLIEGRAEDESEPYTTKQILKVAIDIGKALDYIHTKVKILHGDMKSYNILVNGDFEICKLCDFGVSLPLDENGFLDKEKAGPKATYFGTDLWSAPEVMHGGQITSKTDLFPFGLVLWEMLALMPPHSMIDESVAADESVVCLDDTVLEPPMPYGTRPPIPVNINEEVYSDVLALFYCCTEHIPQMRPSALHIVLCAEDMMSRVTPAE